jgi:hypothetical protein
VNFAQWSSRNEVDKMVVVTLWQDEFKWRGEQVTCSRPGRGPDNPDTRPAFRELMENLQWAQEHCDGRFHVIIARAKDPAVRPRAIAECFPSRIVMRLTHFDPSTGAWTAIGEGNPEILVRRT